MNEELNVNIPNDNADNHHSPKNSQGDNDQSVSEEIHESDDANGDLVKEISTRSASVKWKENQIFINREISWIRFNERVLEEAESNTHPLLERLKFLSIFTSNLDEFFMIRVSGLKEQIDANIHERANDGMSPNEQLVKIHETLRSLLERHSKALMEDVLPKLRREKVSVRTYGKLKENQKKYCDDYFLNQVFSLLTPLAIDSTHPIPQVRGLNINILVELRVPYTRTESRLVFVPIPASIPRFVIMKNGNGYDIIPLEELIEEHLEQLFPNMKILRHSQFRLTRNADLDIAEEEANDLLKLIERELRKRRLGSIIRLEVSCDMPPEHIEFLKRVFKLNDNDVYIIKGYLSVQNFMQLWEKIDDENLHDTPFLPALHPQILKAENIFEAIRQKDILLYHPYDSFNSIIEFIKTAAVDPNVLAIKQTLYRTSSKSPIIEALREAAENGKQVTALIELKARFNEELNISRARELERSGVNVVYGMLGLKIHGKVTLILRKENDIICPYVHLGTGNYNEKTATVYTDFSYLTANKEIGADIAELFNVLTGFSGQREWRHIFVAPINLREQFKKLIYDAIQYQLAGGKSKIRIVMNSLADPEMIKVLYEASQKGVKIELLVRGICCLIPGLTGLSENISVRSIVGRFLEHTRIFSYEYGLEKKIYMGSSDWMQRNLNRRIEILFPILDHDLKRKITFLLDALFRDNLQARILGADEVYRRPVPSSEEPPFSAQDFFLNFAKSKHKQIDTTAKG